MLSTTTPHCDAKLVNMQETIFVGANTTACSLAIDGERNAMRTSGTRGHVGKNSAQMSGPQ
jgi:hypothetical protein